MYIIRHVMHVYILKIMVQNNQIMPRSFLPEIGFFKQFYCWK